MKVCKHCGMTENAVCVRHNPVEQSEDHHPDYATGYRHGSDSEMPNTLGVTNREAYFDGYAKGSEHRDERLSRGEPHIVIPEWMTPKQVEAINVLYRRNPDGSVSRHAFFTRVKQYGVGSDLYAGISWRGMFVGIEPDGYTHT